MVVNAGEVDKVLRIFSVNSLPLINTPPPPDTHTHTIINMRNNKRRSVSTHTRVSFSQSEKSSLLRGEGGRELNFVLLLWWGINRKDPCNLVRKTLTLNPFQ